MNRERELDQLVALLEEHELIPGWESEALGDDKPWNWGHRLIYERVRQTPYFPMSVAQVRDLIEQPTARFR